MDTDVYALQLDVSICTLSPTERTRRRHFQAMTGLELSKNSMIIHLAHYTASLATYIGE